MKKIELSQGGIAFVDDEDFAVINQHRWYAHKEGNTFYAVRHLKGPNKTKIPMHREIMKTPKGLLTDHIDGNGLNNRRSNLRIVTHRQNAQNLHIEKSSIFPGVSWYKALGKWTAQITINHKKIHLGYFEIETEAYEAYLKALTNINEICVNNIIG